MKHLLIVFLTLTYTTVFLYAENPGNNTATTNPSEKDMIQLNFPEKMEVKLLIEYVSKRLKMNIHYDPSIGQKQVTVISPTMIPKDSLPGLLQSVLKMAGLMLVDDDQPGWKRVVPNQDLQSITKNIQQNSELLQDASATTAITQVFQLSHIDADTVEKTIKPFLSKPGGNVFLLPDSNILIATDYAANLRRISSLITLMDVPGRTVNVKFIPVKHRDAASLATLVTSLLDQKQSVASPNGKKATKTITLTPEPVTNQIALIAAKGDDAEVLNLLKILDVPTQTIIQTYSFDYTSPERVSKLLPSLIGKEAEKQIRMVTDAETRSLIVDAPPNVHERILSLKKQLDVAPASQTRNYQFLYISPKRVEKLAKDLIEDPGTQKLYKSTIDEESGLLIVTAPQSVHERIDSLKHRLDIPGTSEQLSNIRSYKLLNSTAADVLAIIKAIDSGETSLANMIGQQQTEDKVKKALQQNKFTGPNQSPSETPTTELPTPPSYTPTKPELSSVKKAPQTQPPGLSLTTKTHDAVVTADPNTNTIIVVAPPAIQSIYQRLIGILDKRRPQVMVEVTMLTLDTSNNFSIGVDLSRLSTGGSNEILTFSSFGLSQVDVNTGQLTIIPGAGFNGSLLSPDSINAVIKALSTDGRTTVLAAPRILVNDNASASLSSVAESPYTSINASDTVATTSFAGYATAGATLTITPHISEGDHIQLEYTITLNSFTGDSDNGVPPPRQTNTLNSNVTVPDGFAVIVGGLTRKDNEFSASRVPGLGHLPGIEYLFSNRTKTDRKSTLFVFIRPVILRDDKFEDLKYISERDLQLAELPSNYPNSDPIIMK